MKNITLRVDEETVAKVRKIAVGKNTTLAAMVRDYLENVAASQDSDDRERLNKLEETFEKYSRHWGTRTWRREDLYSR